MASRGTGRDRRLWSATVGLLAVAVGGTLATQGLAAPTATCLGERATITSSGTINGTEGNDVIIGSDGDDTIDGNGGNDRDLRACRS